MNEYVIYMNGVRRQPQYSFIQYMLHIQSDNKCQFFFSTLPLRNKYRQNYVEFILIS